MYSSLISRLDTPKVPLAIVAVAYLFFIVATLVQPGHGPSYFVMAGEGFCDPDLVPENLEVMSEYLGYDGQFYYRLALDPFTREPTAFGITLENPPYRHQRIVYPFIVWLLSLGRSGPVPLLMILVNYAGLCAMAWVGALLARSLEANALWGLAFPLYPGFLVSLSLDLPEVLALLFVLTALLLLRRERHLSGALFLTLAVLTRETTVLVAVAILLSSLAEAWKSGAHARSKVYFSAIPVVAYAAWELLLFCVWGELPVLSGAGNIGLPLSGLAERLAQMWTLAPHQALERFYLAEICLLFALGVCVAFSLRSTEAHLREKVGWLLYLLFLSVLSGKVWLSDTDFLRALSEPYVLGAVILIGSRVRMIRAMRIPILSGVTAIWLLFFVVRMDYWR